MHKLILFDIDGTLVLTGGAGMRALNRVFADNFGIEHALAGVALAGRTDRAIVEDVLHRHGRLDILHDGAFPRFCDAYFERLAVEMEVDAPGKHVLPGVKALLDRLVQFDDVELALLTGNLEQGARVKLEYFDLWRYFAWGAFGGHTTDRNTLLPVALEEARARGITPRVEHVFVIGDTPHDVACARSGGAVAVGVATGPFTVDALRESGADVVFPDLSDTSRLVALLTADPMPS
jgi:phosphoglycolate phosphatase-like HAD superfamily hydrolase